MSEAKLGQLIDESAQRDAIHVAIIPLVAGERLYRGSRIRLKFGTSDVALDGEYSESFGIVDPFLAKYCVEKGEMFYGVLNPGTVTGMRHHWQHPLFEESPKQASNEHEEWLRNFAEEWNFDYDTLIDEATSNMSGRYVVARGVDLHSRSDLGEDYDLFWFHLEKMLNIEYSESHKSGLIWSCSC